MRKYVLLLMIFPLMLGATYRSKEVTHKWDFTASETLDQLDMISGKWEVVTPATLKQTLLSQTIKYADFPKALIRDKDFYDFDLTTRLYISSENEETQAGGLVFRYRNLYSFYMLFLNAKDKRITLTKASLGGMKVVKRVNQPFETNRWYELRVTCYLDRIRAYVDGEPLLDAEDDTSTGGKIGMVTAGTSRVYFQNLNVRAESIERVQQ